MHIRNSKTHVTQCVIICHHKALWVLFICWPVRYLSKNKIQDGLGWENISVLHVWPRSFHFEFWVYFRDATFCVCDKRGLVMCLPTEERRTLASSVSRYWLVFTRVTSFFLSTPFLLLSIVWAHYFPHCINDSEREAKQSKDHLLDTTVLSTFSQAHFIVTLSDVNVTHWTEAE